MLEGLFTLLCHVTCEAVNSFVLNADYFHKKVRITTAICVQYFEQAFSKPCSSLTHEVSKSMFTYNTRLQMN